MIRRKFLSLLLMLPFMKAIPAFCKEDDEGTLKNKWLNKVGDIHGDDNCLIHTVIRYKKRNFMLNCKLEDLQNQDDKVYKQSLETLDWYFKIISKHTPLLIEQFHKGYENVSQEEYFKMKYIKEI